MLHSHQFVLRAICQQDFVKSALSKKSFLPKSGIFYGFGTNLESHYPLIFPSFITLCVTFNF